MSIIVENITKIYGKQTAVNNVSFSVNEGETCGFLGPNGAGKSTTLKMITGYLIPDKGNIIVNGIDIKKDPIKAKQSIGYLAEHNPVYQDLYVREFLQFIAKTHQLKNTKKAIEASIAQTGLQKEAHKKIRQLSKGYQQRVGLAQALIHNPPILILDEPLSGLDPGQLIELRHLIKELGQEKTLIFSSHILQEVEQVANRILMIKNGSLIVDKKFETITTELVKTIVEFEEELTPEQIEELNTISKVSSHSQHYMLENSSTQIRKKVFQFAVAHNLIITRLEERASDLTELFIDHNS